MDPAVIGTRLASSVAGPLVRKLFVAEGPGAGLVDKPVRLSGYVSFKGEKRTLTRTDLRRLSAELVKQALRTGERPISADEEESVVRALAATLYSLGDLALSDVEAVEMGHTELARALCRASDRPERHLSADATYFYERLLDATCLHIVHFFTQRSTFVAATLVAQSRRQGELIAKVDALIARSPLRGAQDVAFEQRYLVHMAKKHSKLTIFGIDLSNSPGKWPLDAAYLSLEATATATATSTRAVPGLREPFSEEWITRGRPGDWGTRWPGPIHPAVFDSRPADQALANHERVLLRGEAGSGKTTLVQWLAVSAARQDLDDRMAYLRDRIPFVLPLRTLTRHGERLPAPKDFLAAVGSPLAGEQPPGWEARVLTTGRALVLVDGIDEIPDAERSRTRAWLSDLIDTYPGNRWLVTSRPSAVREDWLADEDFTELTLSSMSPADVAAFIKRWHAAARTGSEDEDAALIVYERQLRTAVRTKPDLGHLATNPLMCGLICALHRDRRGFLPLGRKDLYTAALSMLLVRRDRERDMGVPELREEPQIQLLQRLAYWLIRNGRTEMDRARAEAIIADTLPAVPEVAALGDTKAVFDHFLHRSGLLRRPSPGTVDFIHRTFQDFLGARAAVDEGDFGVLVGHAADDQWEDVIRMSVAHARPRERAEFFTDLLAYGDAHADSAVRTRVHLLAAACLEDAAELSPVVRQEVEHRAAALIPPADTHAARELAAAGPVILDLLPGPEELGADADVSAYADGDAYADADAVTAELVVIAASHVASDRAIPYLARFCRHANQHVRAQLIWSWARFDTRPYAEEVIARTDPTNLYFTATTDDQLAALGEIGTRPWLDARGRLSENALQAYAAEATLTHARIRENPSLRHVSFLRSQTALSSLDISDCPQLTDLTGIEGLPLRTLSLATIGGDALSPLSPLKGLKHLQYLRLAGDDTAWSMTDLPSQAPLTTLDLHEAARPTGGLQGLRRYGETLENLQLGARSGPQDVEEWEEIGRLPRLHDLVATIDCLARAPHALTLPSVAYLVLHGAIPASALDRVPELFPNLTGVSLAGVSLAGVSSQSQSQQEAEAFDVSSLATLTELQYIYFPFGTHVVHGLDRLPESTEVYGYEAPEGTIG
ncbi:NACHT domain-containing NTPase [Streptomyces sp. ISL-100]|uniref:NACHT domain-containing protein n=1 Tax=Streptomyces sp. ISL-100 TaxID=2819173 RepID=UPI001BEABFE6|nr:NACHT domain-containing protein [Streptomyces sp. ISL-100]MBT2401479.1 NACHT domain-containing protein [Streptomyces sp. ISL-100]